MGGSAALGGGKTKSESSNVDYGSNVWGPQQGYLTDLWSRAQGMSGQPVQGQQMLDQAGNLLGAGAGMTGAGAQNLNTAQTLLNQMAQQGGSNPALDAYGRQVGQAFNEQIMPQLRGQAASAGQLGSSRAQLGQAAAAGMAQRNIQDFAAEQYQADQARQLQAAQSLQQGGMALGQMGQGLGSLAGQYGQLAGAQAQLPWTNLQAYSGLLGSPVMQQLGGYGTGKSSGWNFNTSGSFSMKG